MNGVRSLMSLSVIGGEDSHRSDWCRELLTVLQFERRSYKGHFFALFVLINSWSRNGQYLSFVDKEWTVLEFRSRSIDVWCFQGAFF